VGIHYTSAASTTYERVIPSFRVFYLDPETLIPVKIDTFKFDREKA